MLRLAAGSDALGLAQALGVTSLICQLVIAGRRGQNMSPTVRTRENILQITLQPLHDLLQPAQRDGLLTPLKTKERRCRDAKLPRKSGVGAIPALPFEERGQLFF